MSRFLSILMLFFISNAAMAQLGTTVIGKSNLGKDKLREFVVGKAATPKCAFPGSCTGGPAVYIFNGSGNWNISGNWKDNVVPPEVLGEKAEIIIDPANTKECILNIYSQTILPGSKLTIIAGKKFRIPGKLVTQTNN